MPLDYCLHDVGPALNGQLAPAPLLPAYGGQKSLAENTDSAAIPVTETTVLCVCSTIKVRLDLQSTAAGAPALDPANAKVVLEADQPRFFTLRKGTWKLKTLAYA